MLKELRNEKKISLKKLGNAIKCSDVAINYWERNIKEPTAPNIVELCKFFDVTADYLLGLEDDLGNKIPDTEYIANKDPNLYMLP